MNEHIIEESRRVEKVGRWAKVRVEAERCVARTGTNNQCTGGLWGGEGGGHVYIDGEPLPLCTRHLHMARAEGWGLEPPTPDMEHIYRERGPNGSA